ncbi:hypothetical protein [Novispirillum itersonii]|uniref:Uncharacterized protein n=1 Tax=Novispirillum itersonii TaxID=189 RepID=A0A7W9ZEJ9_NOVIT|nr:hypothetical protein [Novispirillum itersonii]MBB6210052.1 hypothetical protein [Novispirillum itersonii]
MTRRIVYTATPHGFGHAAILTAVMASVAVRYPAVRQTLVTTVPEAVLRERFSGAYEVVPHQCPTDFGMMMSSTTRIRLPETLDRYRTVHAQGSEALLEWRSLLGRLKPSLVVSSASYMAVAAASSLSVPAVTAGPFLWHDIIQAYAPGAVDVLSEMAAGYQAASAFLLTTPHVKPTVSGPEALTVGPVGLGGFDRRTELLRRGIVRDGERVVFASLGGMQEDVPYQRWLCPSGWRLLTQQDASRTGLRISDLIASASAVVTKPGYGTYVEAALAWAHLISRSRPDWPETTGLIRWYQGLGLPAEDVPEESFSEAGPLVGLAASKPISTRLAGYPGPSGLRTSGAEDCAALLMQRFLA